MARKIITDFDASQFIESFRESAVPSYHTADESFQPEKPQKEKAQDKKSKPTKPTKPSLPRAPSANDALETKIASFNLTEDESEFVRTYLGNSFGQVNQFGKPVVVRTEYRDMIQSIFGLLGITPNMASYIDAVLAGHLRQILTLIQGISEKIPSKF